MRRAGSIFFPCDVLTCESPQAVVGDNNASKIIAETYQDYIEDGTFWESADDIIATYFDNTIDPERVKKMIQYASSTLLM